MRSAGDNPARVTRSIMILKPPVVGDQSETPPASPAGSTTPNSPLSSKCDLSFLCIFRFAPRSIYLASFFFKPIYYRGRVVWSNKVLSVGKMDMGPVGLTINDKIKCLYIVHILNLFIHIIYYKTKIFLIYI